MRGWITFMIVAAVSGPAVAQLAPPRSVPQRDQTAWKAADLASAAAKADMTGNGQEALRLADAAISASPNDPWAYYDRAEALQILKRTSEAVATYREAQRRFPKEESWGKSLAMYGEARAFADASQCADARDAYERYATFVQAADPKSAEMARRYAKDCAFGQTQPRTSR